MNHAHGISYPRTQALAEALAAASGKLRRVFEACAEARGRHIAVRQLERLSDRTLRDIGLERGRIRDAVYGKPL
jgi:uncharacterized protein YjiS (DUF1127 family)